MTDLVAWAQAHVLPAVLLAVWLLVGAFGEQLDRRLEQVDPKQNPRLAGLRDVFHSLGLTPSKLVRGLVAVLALRSGTKLPGDDDKGGPSALGGGGPSDAPSSRGGGAAMRHAIVATTSAILCIVATTPGCADPLGSAIRASNVALELGAAGHDVLTVACTKPLERIAAERLAAGSDAAKIADVAKRAGELAKVCDPAIGTHESLRGAHRALRAVILAVQAGQKGEIAIADALVRLSVAAAELEAALAPLTKKGGAQ